MEGRNNPASTPTTKSAVQRGIDKRVEQRNTNNIDADSAISASTFRGQISMVKYTPYLRDGSTSSGSSSGNLFNGTSAAIGAVAGLLAQQNQPMPTPSE
jgi:hypothetical protein